MGKVSILKTCIYAVILLFIGGCVSTPLLDATADNDVNKVNKILSERKNKKLNSSEEKDYDKALSKAEKDNNIELLNILLNVDGHEVIKDVVLTLATLHKHWDVVNLLLDKNVKPSLGTAYGLLKHDESKALLDKYYTEENSDRLLLQSVKLKDADLVKKILAKGASANSRHFSTYTSVKDYGDSFSVTRTRDTRGMTALGYAIKYENLDIVQILLAKEADPNMRLIANPIGKLHTGFADSLGTSSKNLIIKYGGGKIITKDGATTTFQGVGGPSNDLLAAVNNQITTPLIMTITNKKISNSGKLEIVKLLIKYGANLSDTDEKGLTALQHSEQMGLSEITNYLNKNTK